MRWRGRRGSRNVADRLGRRGGLAVGGGLGIVILLAALLLGGDPSIILDQLGGPGGAEQRGDSRQDEIAQFVSVVLADTEDVWHRLFQEMGATYEEPQLVLFSGSVQSACGFANAAVGPFYCPGDRTIYIDLSFYDELSRRLGAPGDFAQAYVIAHEVGHHVQNLLGIMDQVDDARGSVSEEESNELSVRLELQADFLAGVWANHAEQNWDVLEPGDLEEALTAAAAIGDDKLQMEAQGYVVPDSFTHGTSEQRVRWFQKGFETGDISQGDTFSTEAL